MACTPRSGAALSVKTYIPYLAKLFKDDSKPKLHPPEQVRPWLPIT